MKLPKLKIDHEDVYFSISLILVMTVCSRYLAQNAAI